jgi:hypothetical protein
MRSRPQSRGPRALGAPRTRDRSIPPGTPCPHPIPSARHRYRWHLHRHRPDGRRGTVIATAKTATTPADPSEGALDGARIALDIAGANWSDIAGFIHGTTLATNALIERRGAQGRDDHHRRLPRHPRDRLRTPLRPIRHRLAETRPDRAARPCLHHRRTHRRDRERAYALRRTGRARPRPRNSKEAGSRPPPSAFCTPTPTPPMSCACAMLSPRCPISPCRSATKSAPRRGNSTGSAPPSPTPISSRSWPATSRISLRVSKRRA